ncbi:Lipase [Kerstersia similis]
MAANVRTKTISALLAATASALVLSACGGDSDSGTAHAAPAPELRVGPLGSAFWDVYRRPPADAKPGDVLYIQARSDAPSGAKGWNVVYVSEIAPGKLAYVSGEIYAPAENASVPRDVVLWNHETTGVADACAPSRRNTDEERIPALKALLEKGHIVVMSDYPGQGLPGPAYYMAGQPNARSSLDMLRVAQQMPDINASKRYVMYGWSQGGQTTMWAESIAPQYVPEFTGLGAALIAPGVRIKDLTLRSMTSTSLAGYVISTLPGIKAYFPELRYGDFLTTEGLEQFPAMADGCFDVWNTAANVSEPYKPDALVEGSPWWQAMSKVDDFKPSGSMPFIIFQGDADHDTPIELTLRERDAICEAGSSMEFRKYSGLDHSGVVPEAAKLFPDWADARFKGQVAVNQCDA